MIYHGTEFADKPTFNESMSDVDFLRFIHFRLTELGDHVYYLHVAKVLEVADKLDRLRAENERLRAIIAESSTILYDAPEINPSNYDHDQVCQLNADVIDAYRILVPPTASHQTAGES